MPKNTTGTAAGPPRDVVVPRSEVIARDVQVEEEDAMVGAGIDLRAAGWKTEAGMECACTSILDREERSTTDRWFAVQHQQLQLLHQHQSQILQQTGVETWN